MTAQATPAVRVEHLTKSFGSRRVLDDVTFDIAAGTAFCILGRSGTGKSVTLKHIIGLLRPDSGRVFVEGQEIGTLDSRGLAKVRRRMGFLFQNAALFDSITVGENVAFPLRRHTDLRDAEIRERAREKLEQVGLEHDYDKMPGDLSGGMRKRAGLARAMALGPSVLLVDEPSAGLDPITSGEIDELLLGLKEREKTTLIVVTHNIPSAKAIGDELAMIHEGRLIARGTAGDLEQNDLPMVQAFMRSKNAG
jgi:phospholipid/cholesterol/gamma-HCH transport system ATP-binding protein